MEAKRERRYATKTVSPWQEREAEERACEQAMSSNMWRRAAVSVTVAVAKCPPQAANIVKEGL